MFNDFRKEVKEYVYKQMDEIGRGVFNDGMPSDVFKKYDAMSEEEVLTEIGVKNTAEITKLTDIIAKAQAELVAIEIKTIK
jgi:hypothetical protein